MPEFQGNSDQEETFKFASLLLEAGWMDTHGFVNGTASLQVRTLYVAHGSKIKVTLKDKEAKVLETLEGFVHADLFRKKIALTPAHAPWLFFEVELPDHHLKAIGQKLPVKPAIRVYEPTWKDKATGTAVKDIKRGMDLQIEAKTENLPEGSDARITIREKHGDLHGAHDLVSIPVQVEGNKLSLLWRFEYPKDTYEFSSQDERGRTEEKYAPPKIFFEASAHGAVAKGPEADFLDFVVVEVSDSAGNPRADQKVKLTLPDGTHQEATSDAEGLVKVAATKPGRVEVEWVAETVEEAKADETAVSEERPEPLLSKSIMSSQLICSTADGMPAQDPELSQAEEWQLPKMRMGDPWSLDGLIDAYADQYGFEELAKVLYLLGSEGQGYRIEKADFHLSDWEVDPASKAIRINESEVFSTRTNAEAAKTLKRIIEKEFEGKENYWDVAWRLTKGTGKTVFGVADVVVGVVGIIIPEPATTAGGVLLVAFGTSMTVEGVTQVFRLNHGEGYNPLEEAFAGVGRLSGLDKGEEAARWAFVFANLLVSLGASYKILKVPGQKFLGKGTYSGAGFSRYYSDGFTVGRLQFDYAMGGGGRVFINMVNNSNQWIIRFQEVEGKLVMNGRIIDFQKWHRIESPMEMLKILVKLASHGAGKG